MAERSLTVRLIGDDRSLRAATGRSTTAMGKFANFAKTAAKVGAAGIVTGTVMSVKAFADFDKSMTESLAIMGDVSSAQKREMVDAAREVGRETKFSAKEAAEAYFFLASAGLDAKQSIKALPQVAAFAQAGNFDLATATSLAADAQSALGLASDKAGEHMLGLTRVTDVLVKGNILANAEVDQLSESLTNKAGAAAKVLGKDIEETTAVLAAFAGQGVKGQVAGNALNIVWRDLQTAALKNKAAFEEQGIAVFNSAGEMRNTAAIVGQLERALGDMSDEEKKATLAKLGFKEESQAFVLTLLGTSSQIRDFERDLRKAGGTTQTVADKQLRGLSGAVELLRGEVEDGALALGGALAPTLQKAAEWMRGFIGEVRTGTGAGGDFRTTVESLANTLIPIGAAVGSVSVELAQFTLGLASSKAGIVTLSAIAGGLVGRLVALGAVWAVGKIIAFASAIGSAVTMVRTAIQITTSLRAAIGLLTASTIGLRAAMLTSGIGAIAVVAGVAIGALTALNSTSSKTVSTYQALRNMMSGLEASSERLENARKGERNAAQRVKDAEQRLLRARREHGPNSQRAAQAEIKYAEALDDSARATRRLRNMERVHGAERRATMAVLRVDIRKLARETEHANTVRAAEAEGLKGLLSMYRRGEVGLGQLRTRLRQYREAAEEADKKNRNLNETIARAAQELGPKQARALEKLADGARKSFRQVDPLARSLNRLPRRKKTDVEVDIKIGDVGFGGGGPGGSGSGWPLSEHIDTKVRQKVRSAAANDPMGLLGAASGLSGLTGTAPGNVEGFTPIAGGYGLSMTSGYRPGDDGYHGTNRARDYSNSSGPTSQMMAFARFMAAVFGPILRELIYSPLGFSIKDGVRVPPYAVGDHFDHVHVALQRGGFAFAGATGTMVPGYGSGDKVPVSILAEPNESIFVLNRNATAAAQALAGLNAVVPRFQGRFQGGGVAWGKLVGSHWDNNELATLAHVVGMPSPGLMARYAQGESGGDADARNVNTDGSVDTGLWQINSVHGFSGDLTDPLVNARAAKSVLASQGLGAWYASPTGPRGKVDPDLAARIRSGGATGAGSGPPTKEQRQTIGGLRNRAERILDEAQDLKGEYKKRGGTKKGRRELDRALRFAREAAKAARAGNTEEAKDLITRSRETIGKSRDSLKGAREGVFTPGMKAGKVPAALTGVPGAKGLFSSPGLTPDQRYEASESLLTLAERTEGTEDDSAIYSYQLGAAERRRKALQKELKRINDRLRKGGLTKAQRQKLAAKRDQVIEELTNVQSRIGAAREGMAGLNEGEGEDPHLAAIEKQTEAIEKAREAEEEHTRMIEEQKAEVEALRKEMELNRHIAESELGTAAAVAKRALADIISGELGPRSYHRAQTAGAGTVGSL
jgi:TP901 family phage tail tape measure protein